MPLFELKFYRKIHKKNPVNPCLNSFLLALRFLWIILYIVFKVVRFALYIVFSLFDADRKE